MATARNSLKLHDIDRDITKQNAQIFPVIGPLMDPKTIPEMSISVLIYPFQSDLCRGSAEVCAEP